MMCATCHRETNGELLGSPPGALDWRLAPREMGWTGLSAGELCRQLKDLAGRQGGDVTLVIGHIVDGSRIDPLVRWAWEPGPGREPAPGTLPAFIQVLQWWKAAGADCPT